MRILGGKYLLEVNEPKLIYEFWTTSERCREVLQNPTSEIILSILKNNFDNPCDGEYGVDRFGFSVWTCDNSYQVINITRITGKEPWFNEEDEEYIGELNCSDTNVCGDASPSETLWFVFEEDEWKIFDEKFDVDLTGSLKEIWGDCVELSKEKHNNTWAKEELKKYDPNFKGSYGMFSKQIYLPYSDIVNANIEVKLK